MAVQYKLEAIHNSAEVLDEKFPDAGRFTGVSE